MQDQSGRSLFPIALELFGGGSQVVVCSEKCVDALEVGWYPRVRFNTMPQRLLGSDWCVVCVICGKIVVRPITCPLHEGECPKVQWRLTLQGMEATQVALKFFGYKKCDEALQIVEDLLGSRPGLDPIALLYGLHRHSQ